MDQISSPPNEQAVSLRNETIQLLEMFTVEYKSRALSDMLHGAWIILYMPGSNPDYLAQAAHSIREFTEKAHDNIVEVPVKIQGVGLKESVISLNSKWTAAIKKTSINTTDWSGVVDSHFQKVLKSLGAFFATFSVEYRPRAAQQRAVLDTLDGSGQPIPEKIASERVKLWKEMDDFFKAVAHHKIVTSKEDLELRLIALEDFILDIKYPERALPIDTLDELDDLIAQGNAL